MAARSESRRLRYVHSCFCVGFLLYLQPAQHWLRSSAHVVGKRFGNTRNPHNDDGNVVAIAQNNVKRMLAIRPHRSCGYALVGV